MFGQVEQLQIPETSERQKSYSLRRARIDRSAEMYDKFARQNSVNLRSKFPDYARTDHSDLLYPGTNIFPKCELKFVRFSLFQSLHSYVLCASLSSVSIATRRTAFNFYGCVIMQSCECMMILRNLEIGVLY